MNQIDKVARAFPALWDLVQYHKSGGHSGSGGDRALANALREVAAIAAMQPAPQWQGIESAPRDWTDVLVFSPKHSGFNCGGVFSAFYDPYHPGWFAHGPDDNIPLTPTHWMPLPTPPAGGSDAE